MSTIFGIFERGKEIVKSSSIRLLTDTLSYWDSDDEGTWSENSIFLGHRMLYNTPQSKLEHLPRIIHSDNQTFVITIDARLDNREILVDQLNMTDLSLGQITDSDLILSAYQKWGEECPKYLLGDFVFVIWDMIKEKLFCARDHIGIKPFYYHLSDDLFVFSNDIRGLIALPGINEKYNKKSIAMELAEDLGFYDDKDTLFEEIQKLPAATSLTITKENVSEFVYWDIENISEIHYSTYEEYVKKLKELLSDAVKSRLRTNYPVASHLSGGLDSSTISVLAARELEKRNQLLYAFNWVETPNIKHDPDLPEWSFATQLASLENIEAKSIKLTSEYIAEMYDEIDISKEDSSIFWSEYLVRDEAEKCMARTILSGWGGDELISYDGYAYLSGLVSQGHFLKALHETSTLYQDKKYKYLHMIKRLLKELIYPYFYKQLPGLYQKREPEFDSFEFTQNQFSSLAQKFSFPDYVFLPGAHNEQKLLFKEGHILKRVENWASSAFEKKLEYSYPLLDKRIVEFALAVPEELYAKRNGHNRYFFKSVISNFLPEHIVWEAKISEPEHGKVLIELWYEALRLWMLKNENTSENKNCLIDRSKIIKRIKTYFTNKDNGIEDKLIGSKIVISILLSNLKDKGISSNRDKQESRYPKILKH